MRILYILCAVLITLESCIAEDSQLQRDELNFFESRNNYLNHLEKYVFKNTSQHPSNCTALNGIHTIKLTDRKPFPVVCDSGWLVILSRFEGDLNFFRDWSTYKEGFGNLSSDFFIGLEKLHAITASQAQEVYIQLEDFNGTVRYALYDDFLIGNETEAYAMQKLGNYSGNAGDSLSYHLNMKFTTYDQDNDNKYDGNCAIERMGAWWYNFCNNSHLFGMYLRGAYSPSIGVRGITWWDWHGPYYSYKKVSMMVRPKIIV